MSYARYSTTDRWRWVDGCVHEHVSVFKFVELENANSFTVGPRREDSDGQMLQVEYYTDLLSECENHADDHLRLTRKRKIRIKFSWLQKTRRVGEPDDMRHFFLIYMIIDKVIRGERRGMFTITWFQNIDMRIMICVIWILIYSK